MIHINHVYSWTCGSVLGFTTTNEKDVTCPDCLAAKPVDITAHPLADFFRAVAAEYDASKDKYDPWSEHNEVWQHDAINSEIYEVKAAMLKADNGKRFISESAQLANVLGKRWNELRKNQCTLG